MNYILLVDDMAENLSHLSALFERSDIRHESTANGVEALARAREFPPSIVLSDLLMPVMDGYALLREWKADSELKKIPFVVYTATYTDSEDEQLALDLGADAFIQTVGEPAELVARLKQLIAAAAASSPASPRRPSAPEKMLLKEYNEALVRKLESKTLQLHAANRALKQEMALRRVNVTHRREAELKRRESEAQYLLLLNSTAEGIYRLDTNGICTFCNPTAARLLGYQDAQQLVGLSAHEHHHHSRSDGAAFPKGECQVHLASQSNEGTHGDNEVFLRADGSQFPVEYWSYPILSGPDLAGRVVTFLDITQRRDLEAQFLQSQKMEAVGRLAGGVAHDFNNALQVILFYAELLEERLLDDAVGIDYNGQILAAGRRGASLTRQLLALSRKQLMRPVALDIRAVTNEIETMLRRTIGEDISLTLRHAPSVGTIEADRGQIEQVLINLAVNARDAMPSGGELIIETSSFSVSPADTPPRAFIQPGDYSVLTIRDTGVGMDSGTQARIFEPFFTTKEPGRGTGLGLSTVYGIVKQSKGYVIVDSEPGKGSQFRLYFPVVQRVVEHSAAREPVSGPLRGCETVFLVEDEHSLRSVVGATLRANGYRVLDAQDGHSAIELARDFAARIDLLLTDVILPGVSGRGVAEQLRLSRPAMKVVYMSGYTDDFIVHHGIIDPQTVLLEKPFPISLLLRTIREALDAEPAGSLPRPLQHA